MRMIKAIELILEWASHVTKLLATNRDSIRDALGNDESVNAGLAEFGRLINELNEAIQQVCIIVALMKKIREGDSIAHDLLIAYIRSKE